MNSLSPTVQYQCQNGGRLLFFQDALSKSLYSDVYKAAEGKWKYDKFMWIVMKDRKVCELKAVDCEARPEVLEKVRSQMVKLLGAKRVGPHIWLNHYPDGESYVRAHRDSSNNPEGDSGGVAMTAFGDKRTVEFWNIKTKEWVKIPFGDGDVIWMNGEWNIANYHRIQPANDSGPRISMQCYWKRDNSKWTSTQKQLWSNTTKKKVKIFTDDAKQATKRKASEMGSSSKRKKVAHLS